MSLSSPLLAVPLLLLLGACAGTSPEGAAPAPVPAPTAFPAVSPGVPAGYRLEQCPDLRVQEGSGLTLRLVVPDAYRWSTTEGAGCSFQTQDERAFSLTLAPAQSLADFRDTYVTPFDRDDGDDGVSGVAYAAEVPVLGGRSGEMLAYEMFNDGLPLSTRIVQADGVRLSWSVAAGDSDAQADVLATVIGSLAVVEDDLATCSSRGLTVRYLPPLPQTETIDSSPGDCYLYLRPRESLQRHAEVRVSPATSLTDLAARLERDTTVSDVVLERGAAHLDGAPADRLTWVVTLTTSRFGSGPGTWRTVAVGTTQARMTWVATPEQWDRDEAAYDAFVDSLDVVGAPG